MIKNMKTTKSDPHWAPTVPIPGTIWLPEGGALFQVIVRYF